jgi:hypothetical protein
MSTHVLKGVDVDYRGKLVGLAGLSAAGDRLAAQLRLVQRHMLYGVATGEELTELHRAWMTFAFLAEIIRLDDSRLDEATIARAAAEAYIERGQLVYNSGPLGQS